MELTQQYRTNIEQGLDTAQATSRVSEYGKNTISPPPSNWMKKIIGYFFGGFCGLFLLGQFVGYGTK